MSASTLCVSARCRKGEKQMACAYVVCTVKHGGGGVMGLVTLLAIIHISWQYIPSWLPQHPAGKHPPIWFMCNSRFFSLNSQKKGTIDQNRKWVLEVNRGARGSGTEFDFTLTWWLYRDRSTSCLISPSASCKLWVLHQTCLSGLMLKLFQFQPWYSCNNVKLF